MRHLCCLLAALLTLVLSGCGGGATSSGRATVQVRWPERSRLIPFAANSIRVTISQGTRQLGTALLVRPTSGGNASTTFTRLPVGAATVTAIALPNVDGTGVAQASGQATTTIVASQTASVHLTLASTIASLTLAPATPGIAVGQTVTLVPTAKNAAGELVLIALSTVDWTSDSGAATVAAGGVVTGAANGSAHITARESESGKSATAMVNVGTVPPGSANGNVAFGSPTVYSVASAGPVLCEDFDGDGRRDVIISGGVSVWIFYGRGDGTLEPKVELIQRIDGLILDAVRDMNGDGRPDVVVHDGLGKVHVIVNLGARAFAAPKTTFVGGISWVGVGDFTGDGRPDAAGLRPGSGPGGSFVVLINSGDGTLALTPDSYGLPDIPDGLICGDLNGDGRTDVVTSFGSNTIGRSGVQVYLGNGAGKFTFKEGKNWGTLNSPTPALGDIDRDGKLDLVQSAYWDGVLVVYRGRGDGTLIEGIPYSSPPYPLTLRAADVNADGWPDLFTANAGSTYGTVLLNRGDTTFADRVAFESGGSNIRWGEVGDLNGDGKPELLLSGESSGTLSVLINQTP